jgi:hypothetical protein
VTLVLADDGSELVRSDEPGVVSVEVLESLTNALALQTTQHLCKLLICHGMSSALSAKVETGPRTIEVERQAVLTALLVVDSLQVFDIDCAGVVDVKQTEDHEVLRSIRSVEDVVECSVFILSDSPFGSTVCDKEEGAVLFARDLVLSRCQFS